MTIRPRGYFTFREIDAKEPLQVLVFEYLEEFCRATLSLLIQFAENHVIIFDHQGMRVVEREALLGNLLVFSRNDDSD